MENDEWQERRTEPVNERDTMKNSRKTNVKSNTSDIEAKEKKEQQEQEKILAAKYLIELIRSVLEERKPQPKPEQISMKCLFLTAKKHNLACMAYDAARQIAGKEDKEVMETWQTASRSCEIMNVVQKNEGKKLLVKLTDEQIRVLPMKGWIMKQFYPKPEYRQMGDLDFLIDSENRKPVREIMTDLGYGFVKNECEDTVDVYQKNPWMHVEIHNRMIPYKNKKRYENIWERCEQKDDLYFMSWDDYYLFMLDHLEKHFYDSGCGIRFLLDVYIFLQAKGKELHRDKLKEEFRKRDQEAKNIANALADKAVTYLPKLMGISAPNIAEEAITPTVPTSPSTKKNVALGGILALALIVGIYTVRFLMDDTVKTAEDVEKIIGVMPLTVILEYQDKDKKKKGRHRRK